jgi:hypothetical protein
MVSMVLSTACCWLVGSDSIERRGTDETVPNFLSFLAALLRRPPSRLMPENHALDHRPDDFLFLRVESGDGFELKF